MKKLISKILILLFSSLIVLITYNHLYQSIRFRDLSPYSTDKYLDIPYNIQLCNFGSSHGVFGFDYSSCSEEYTTFNFALLSQSLSYDYRILQQYEDHLADNGTMFIVISYFSFGLDEESESDFMVKNERYYTFLNSRNIKQYDLLTDIKHKYFHAFFENPETAVAYILKAGKKGSSYEHYAADVDYLGDAKKAYSRHHHADDTDNIIVLKDEEDALLGMLEICRKHQIRPILVTTPYRKEYNDLFSESYLSSFYTEVKSICNISEAEYYDYSHDERFTLSNEYERNADHLSSEGAKVFTDILINECVKK